MMTLFPRLEFAIQVVRVESDGQWAAKLYVDGSDKALAELYNDELPAQLSQLIQRQIDDARRTDYDHRADVNYHAAVDRRIERCDG